eukprot:scaffold800_cov159-Pinguiococcus_pyrenoidosus.AAC.4
MSDVAVNHFDDFSTVATDDHADQWVSRRSVGLCQPQASACIEVTSRLDPQSAFARTGANLVGLDLAVNPTPTPAQASAFDVARDPRSDNGVSP